MGLVYNTATNRFNVTYEPTDAKTNWQTDLPVKQTIEYSGFYDHDTTGDDADYNIASRDIIVYNILPDGTKVEADRITITDRYIPGDRREGIPGRFYTSCDIDGDCDENKWDRKTEDWEEKVLEFNGENGEGAQNANKNKQHTEWNSEAAALNAKNAQINAAYNAVLNRASATVSGEYLTQRDALRRALANAPAEVDTQDLEDQFNEFYRDQKLNPVTLNLEQVEDLSKLDPRIMGRFNADWYGSTYSSNGRLLKDVWDEAKKNKDLDIIGTYSNPQTYYFNHYIRNRQNGNRGNPIEATAQANAYLENKPTDAEIQQLRERQLGVNLASSSERLLAVPYIATEWEKAKNGDPYWKELAKENYLDVTKEDEFAALFRLSNRDEDKQVAFTNNLNSDSPYGISELEDAIAQAAGEKAVVDVKKFGALAQDTLKAAIDEIKKAKQQEQMMELYKGFGGFDEIINVNDTITNSLLGDLNIGGFMPLGKDFEENFEEGIKNVTGIGNNATYNWQKWFDNTLSERYKENIELGLTPEEADEKIKIDAEFLQAYLDDYLVPRFDESRSMNEFVEYIDVRQEEQNPFQTQDLLNSLKYLADLKAEAFINTIKDQGARGFDAEFYFNPTGNDARSSDYAAQSERVNSDWARAQKNLNSLVDPNDPNSTTWAQQAYRFGLDPTKKDDFARMHFQIIGQGEGYDAAEDILNASKVKDFIYGTILPLLEDETERIGTVFGEFIKPEEFADDVLEGLDPSVPEDWEKVLEDLGIEDFKGSLEELKEYVANAVRTGSAEDIRRSIKYLNERREKPTQQNLGITYIEREEDEAPEKVKAETQLYQVFVDAGYGGTEDEFYEKFMPDVNREEMALVTSAEKGEGFSFDFGDLSDPFSAFGSIESFFPDKDSDQQEDDEDKKKNSGSSIFDLSLDLDDPSEKSDDAESFLGDFASAFKFG